MVEIYKPPTKRISTSLMQKLQLFEDHPSTKQGREQEGRVIGITPNYKIGEGQPKSELNLGKTGYLPNGHGDYKMTSLQETYKQTLIDPKVC
ncbi:hypothetical protein B9Z55_008381 [Caenorhabditis nigoni]|uniref:Uncharacterized protein n=1 Tax=Caenorhabditis nigoni TaxID=1611254 RepID=A0A2G5UMH7_9PELO|nr:hypothetical protein B9Z55_008381 [Caenorhabditis nigoni]